MNSGVVWPETWLRPKGGLPNYRWRLSIVVHSSSRFWKVQIEVHAVNVIQAAFRDSCSISQEGSTLVSHSLLFLIFLDEAFVLLAKLSRTLPRRYPAFCRSI